MKSNSGVFIGTPCMYTRYPLWNNLVKFHQDWTKSSRVIVFTRVCPQTTAGKMSLKSKYFWIPYTPAWLGLSTCTGYIIILQLWHFTSGLLLYTLCVASGWHWTSFGHWMDNWCRMDCRRNVWWWWPWCRVSDWTCFVDWCWWYWSTTTATAVLNWFVTWLFECHHTLNEAFVW